MRQLRFKKWPIGSTGVWVQGDLKDLLRAIPSVHYALAISLRIPSLEELNTVFARGQEDAGMTGACEWAPFQLSAEEYADLVEDILTEPGSRIQHTD